SEDVSMVSRDGTRIHLRVDGDIMPTLAVNDMNIDYEQNWNPFAPGTATVTYTVANEGNERLGAEQAPHSAGPFGFAEADQQPSSLRGVLPGDQTQVLVEQDVRRKFARIATIELDPHDDGEDVIDSALTTGSGEPTAATIPNL